MKYIQQSTKPAFFNSNTECLYASATSGTSPFNEWYEFDSRQEAVEFIATTFTSQSFVDGFQCAQGEIWDAEELWKLLTAQFGDGFDFDEVIDEADLTSLEPASLQEMVWAESRF